MADWVADGVAAAALVVSVGVGLSARRQARRANEAAERSAKAAERSAWRDPWELAKVDTSYRLRNTSGLVAFDVRIESSADHVRVLNGPDGEPIQPGAVWRFALARGWPPDGADPLPTLTVHWREEPFGHDRIWTTAP